MRDCPGAGPDDPEQRDGGLVGPGRSTGAYQTPGQEDPQKERLPSGQAGEGDGDGVGTGRNVVWRMGGLNTKRRSEKTQPMNPHGLTINQHVLPVKTIERFAGVDRRVAVIFKEGRRSSEIDRLSPKNILFCAKRVWNQRSEDIAKKTYEDPFQDLAERVIAGTTQCLDPKDNVIATCFFGLWVTRFLARKAPPQDKPVFGVTGIESQDLRERLERGRVSFVNPDRTISGRHLADMEIQKGIDKILMDYANWSWGIVEAQELEFVVPDCPGVMYLPISPMIALLANDQQFHGKACFSGKEVKRLNKVLFGVTNRYLFANSLPGTTLWT